MHGRAKYAGVAAVGAVVVAVAVNAAVHDAGRSRPTPTTKVAGRSRPFVDLSRAEDLAFARRFAATMGDAHPTRVETVDTRERTAIAAIAPGHRVLEHGIAVNEPVRLFVMQGRFTSNVPMPRGEPPVKGTWLSVIFDLATGEELGMTLSGRRPDLRHIGAVRPIAVVP